MKVLIFSVLIFLAFCNTTIKAQTITLHLFGDSTMADYDPETTDRRGWGTFVQDFFKENCVVVNRAKSGIDSRYCLNYIWPNAKKEIRPGDYVVFQFGHNEIKQLGIDYDSLYNYYMENNMTAEAKALTSRGTTPLTYKYWLGKLVQEAIDINAHPILVSSTCRAVFYEDGKLNRKSRHNLGDNYNVLTKDGIVKNNSVGKDDNSMDYMAQTKKLAEEFGIPFIDITNQTKILFEDFYKNKGYKQFMHTESTHFCEKGAKVIAELFALQMLNSGLLKDYIKRENVLGDANMDQIVNIQDTSFLIEIILGNKTQFSSVLSDINQDNKINIEDVSNIISLLLNK